MTPRDRTMNDDTKKEGRTMDEYQIDKDRPVPARTPRGLYPWDAMSPGDSFFEPCRDGESPYDAQKRMTNAGQAAAKRRGYRLATRQEGNGVRVWFTEGGTDDAE